MSQASVKMFKIYFLLIFTLVAAVRGANENEGSLPSSSKSVAEEDSYQSSTQPSDQSYRKVQLLTSYDMNMFEEFPTYYIPKRPISDQDDSAEKIKFDKKQILVCGQSRFVNNIGTQTIKTKSGEGKCASQTIVHKKARCTRRNFIGVSPIIGKLQNETDANSDNMRDVPCGPKDRDGYMFAFGYNTCGLVLYVEKFMHNFPTLPEPTEENADFIDVYKFCYSEKDDQVIYTEHIIQNPQLLTLYLLKIQQVWDEKYKMKTEGYGYFDSKYKTVKKAYEKLNDQNIRRLHAFWDSHPNQRYIPEKGFLPEPQQLVPVDDMAPTLKREVTYHYLNLAPMREGQIRLWHYINHLIREDGRKNDIEYKITTGALFLNPREKFEGTEMTIEEVDVWIKIVRYDKQTSEPEEQNKKEGFAIVMNAAPDEADMKEFNDRFCPENICENAFASVKFFSEIRTSVRCCPVNEIAEIFFDERVRCESSFMIESFTKFVEMTPEEENAYLKEIFSFLPEWRKKLLY